MVLHRACNSNSAPPSRNTGTLPQPKRFLCQRPYPETFSTYPMLHNSASGPAIEHQGQISTGFYSSLKISPAAGRRPAAELILKLSD